MDFERVLRTLIEEFRERNVSYALIGGFALGALQIPRATIDIDLLVRKSDSTDVKEILESRRYKVLYESENVIQYISEHEELGSIDII